MRLLIIVLVIAVVYWLATRTPSVGRMEPDEAENHLLHLCLGDRALAERLIAAELARAPGIDRARAVDRVRGQLSRDKR